MQIIYRKIHLLKKKACTELARLVEKQVFFDNYQAFETQQK